MYERTYGSNYDGKLSTKEIAAKIRSRIKELVKEGKLPADWKYSTRYESFSMGTAIRMTATSPRPIYLMEQGTIWAKEEQTVRVPIEGKWVNLHMYAGDRHEVRRYDTEIAEARRVRETLQALHSSYNHNGSDIQTDYFDVNYYGQVEVTTVGGWQNEYEEKLPVYTTAGR